MAHTTELPVAWGDTDAGGLIYYPNFFHYAVVGLNAYFAPAVAEGHLMETLRQDGFVLPAVDASASFRSPLRAGDTARIAVTVTEVGTASLSISFAVRRGSDDQQAASGTVTFVLVGESFEAAPLPDNIRECVRDRGDARALDGES